MRIEKLLAWLAAALAGDRRGDRTAAALLVLYALLWWAYALVAKSTQDIHFDMGEVFSWSTVLSYGYPKHPPFPAWVAAAWFAVFPRTDWAFYLLSTTSIALALWFAWLISTRFLDGNRRAAALMLLALTPIFNFQPLKFNSNALLIPTWAGATWLFLRSCSARTLMAGALAGAGAAIAMLTKYWSVFLIIGMIAGAFAQPRWRDYFRSPAPYASIAVGAVLLAPNIATLFKFDFYAFKYAKMSHGDASLMDLFRSMLGYLSGLFYLLGPFFILQIAAGSSLASWREVLWPAAGWRRYLAVIILTSLLTPIAASFAFEMRLDALWTMPCWAALPALVLSAPRLAVSRRAAATVLGLAYAVPLVALVASPLVAVLKLRSGDNFAPYESLLAHEVDRLWPQISRSPLRYVAGPESLAWGCTFYCRDRPLAYPSYSGETAPWIDPADLMRSGFVALCPADIGQQCVTKARTIAGNAQMQERKVKLARSAFGMQGPTQDFVILLKPPEDK